MLILFKFKWTRDLAELKLNILLLIISSCIIWILFFVDAIQKKRRNLHILYVFMSLFACCLFAALPVRLINASNTHNCKQLASTWPQLGNCLLTCEVALFGQRQCTSRPLAYSLSHSLTHSHSSAACQCCCAATQNANDTPLCVITGQHHEQQ